MAKVAARPHTWGRSTGVPKRISLKIGLGMNNRKSEECVSLHCKAQEEDVEVGR